MVPAPPVVKSPLTPKFAPVAPVKIKLPVAEVAPALTVSKPAELIVILPLPLAVTVLLKVMLLVVLLMLMLPLLDVLIFPLVVIDPPAIIVKLEPALMFDISIALTSDICTGLNPLFVAVTLPVKSLAWVNVITPEPPLNVTSPAPDA